MISSVRFFFLFAAGLTLTLRAAPFPDSPLDKQRARYFEAETVRLESRALQDVKTLEDWTRQREDRRRELLDMLGLWPMPERTDLKPVVTGRIEHDEFTVEKVHFQAMPRVYVTANLYLPKKVEKPVPAILYVCGHARVVTNGVSCGNKTGYQHHGIWFARNGYVALLVDTIQLGEIEGLHHGTYRENMWWWNSCGYTPAGTEAWFGIRALDYLCSRPEVDAEKIGMTGRSGGGAYSWTVAALDDRVKVAAPVAGITDLRNHVVDGVVEGHCDCMFYLNTRQWDFATAAALIAPRPLLFANSDKDTIFPLDGVVRVHRHLRRIYDLHGKPGQLGLLITEGPHADTQDLQVPVFRWFNRFLKGEQPLIEMAAVRLFDPLQLRVFDTLPGDQLNTRFAESFFVPKPAAAKRTAAEWSAILREKVFAAWPEETSPIGFDSTGTRIESGLRINAYSIRSQPGVEPTLWVVQGAGSERPREVVLHVLDAGAWSNSPGRFLWSEDAPAGLAAELEKQVQSGQSALAFLVPRDVQPTPLLQDPKKAAQVRRRYMLLGQTQDSMRVWDVRCGIRVLQRLPEFARVRLLVTGSGLMGVNAAYAALFEPGVTGVELTRPPASHLGGPDYLGVLKVWDIPQLLEVLGSRAVVHSMAAAPRP